MDMEYPHAAIFIVFACTCMGSMIQMRLLFRLGRTASLVLYVYKSLVAAVIMPNSDGSVVHGQSHKAKPHETPASLITKFKNVAEETNGRCKELQRMTGPDMMRTSARAKAECKKGGIAMDRDDDVPHDCIIDQEDTCTQWLNRYSATSLRWPLFDCMSLLSWVWGLPMVVPNAELGDCFNMDWCSVVCLLVTGGHLSVHHKPR